VQKIRLEFQYFEDCPNHKKLKDSLLKALQGIEEKVELLDVLVEDELTAARVRFRGSPTLLINGEDLEKMPAPSRPFLTCRFYPNGIPSAEAIRSRIEQQLSGE
jgi:hypothetical protein